MRRARRRTQAGFADGVVVGSALVKIIASHGSSPHLTREVRRFVHGLKEGTRLPEGLRSQ